MKLKELIEKADLKEVADLFYWSYKKIKGEDYKPDKKKILERLKVWVEAASEPCEEETFDLSVTIQQDMFTETYVSVSMVNKGFVCDPPEGLKAWGGDEERDDCPEGHYNCNWNGYHRVFGIGGNVLNKQFYEGEIKFENCSFENFYGYEGLLYEIIWELTFYGWDDAERTEFFSDLKEKMDSAKPEDYISWEEFEKRFDRKV